MRFKASLTLAFVAGCAGKAETSGVTSTPIAPAPKPEIIKSPPEPEPQAPLEAALSEPEAASEQDPESEPVVLASRPTTPTTLGLCEPIGERWKYPNRKQKRQVRALIKRTCDAMGVGEEDCKYFRDIISLRESHYRPWVRHALASDVSAALNSYVGNAWRYGWTASWEKSARKQADVSQIVLVPYGDDQNQYFLDSERWMFGLGLGGLNISYHLEKFDAMAPPEILCDPVINAMIQITIARNAVVKYDAQNFAEIQAIYAGRKYYNRKGYQRPLSCSRGCADILGEKQIARARKGDKRILNRCEKKELDCHKTPELGEELLLQDMTLKERYKAAAKIRGHKLPGFDTPPKAEE